MNQYVTGTIIRQLREKSGMTQAELAEKLYVSDKTVSKWEKGLSIPDVQMLIKIAEVLEVSINELVCNEHAIRKVDMQMKYDVIIIGMGPAGISAALRF